MDDIQELDFVKLTEAKLSVEELHNLVTEASTGATSIFVGTTRDNFQGKEVVRLEYEAYVPMAEKELRKVCGKIRAKWKGVYKIAIYHRLGLVPVTEASVIIAVSSEHRKDGLEAVHFGIDELKATVPIWKKEVYREDGESRPKWKENAECKWAIKNRGYPQVTNEDDDEEVQVEEDQVQIKASKAEIDRRIEAFIERKREEINGANVLEFCNRHVTETNEFSCARVDSVVPRRTADKASHLRQTAVVNPAGPEMIKTENIEGEETSKIPEAIKERLEELERKMTTSMKETSVVVPKDVYERLKALEDHVRFLEGVSPEYFDRPRKLDDFSDESGGPSGRKKSRDELDLEMRIGGERKEEIQNSLTGINTRIQELQDQLKKEKSGKV